jgi:uncharacterized membrane protein
MNKPPTFLSTVSHRSGKLHEEILRTIKAKTDAKRTQSERLADWMTTTFGTMTFLTGNTIVFFVWILINTNNIPGVPAFDPFPFSLLTTIVSLEAIILAVFVLISQNRTVKVADLREEIHLQINLIAEKEITKLMKMTAILLEKNGVDVIHDSELQTLIKPISEEEIERKLEKEIL